MNAPVAVTNKIMTLTPEDYVDDAQRLGCELAAILAVFQVESAGKGFYADGVPRTLFEGHIFHRLTNGRFSKTHPTLSYPKWTKQYYGKTEAIERARLDAAGQLDRTAALLSTSWGLPQIMGFNHVKAGFPTLQKFINAMYRDANTQLEAFTTFVINSELDDELRRLDWTGFARIYNGSGQVDYYANLMAKAYAQFKRKGF